MPLCDICSKIVFVPISTLPSQRFKADRSPSANRPPSNFSIKADPNLWTLFTRSTEGYVAFLHPNFNALEMSVAKGAKRGLTCSFCEIIYARYKHSKMGRIWITEEMSKGKALWLYCESIGPATDGVIEIGCNASVQPYGLHISSIKFDTITEDHNPCPVLDDTTTGSLSALDRAKSWINQCRSEHPECRARPVHQIDLPTRLVNINASQGPDQIISLVEPAHQPLMSTEYATLSHRWGMHMPIQTTTELLEKHKQGIPLSVIPLTFRDAISVVLHMGLQYIWIDSLCILQDSQQDKTLEIPRMADYYGNAAFNIAASGSEDSQGGCFKRRNGRIVMPQTIPVLVKESGKASRAHLTVRPRIGHGDSEPFSLGSTLDSRGWVFQEQVFARRILYFEKSHLSFSCSSIATAECFPSPINHQDTTHLPLRRSHKLNTIGSVIRALEAPSELDKLNRMLLYNIWYEALADYTSRKLTYNTDRLHGISSLAQRISCITGGMYLGGLWKSDLLYSLCWVKLNLNDHHQEMRANEARAGRIYPYCAPTWSWASISSPIQMSSKIEDVEPHKDTVTYYDGKEWFRILDCYVEPALGNPFGIVNHAALVVSGHLRTAILRGSSVYGPENLGTVHLDVAVDDIYVHLLPIRDVGYSYRRNNAYEGPKCYVDCLVLENVGNATYQRVGFMHSILDYTLSGFRCHTFTIV